MRQEGSLTVAATTAATIAKARTANESISSLVSTNWLNNKDSKEASDLMHSVLAQCSSLAFALDAIERQTKNSEN